MGSEVEVEVEEAWSSTEYGVNSLLRCHAEKQQSNLHPPSHDWQDSLCLEALYADLATASGREVE